MLPEDFDVFVWTGPKPLSHLIQEEYDNRGDKPISDHQCISVALFHWQDQAGAFDHLKRTDDLVPVPQKPFRHDERDIQMFPAGYCGA